LPGSSQERNACYHAPVAMTYSPDFPLLLTALKTRPAAIPAAELAKEFLNSHPCLHQLRIQFAHEAAKGEQQVTAVFSCLSFGPLSWAFQLRHMVR
jgi:hypothetical protein